MRKTHYIFFILYLLSLALNVSAQERRVEHRPYTDLRPVHFGVLLGAHLQDIDMVNLGYQTISTEEGGTGEQELIAVEADKWSPGFNVGVMADFRLNKFFSFRLTPQLHFGAKNIRFWRPDIPQPTDDAAVSPFVTQDMKTTYITLPLNVKISTERMNNHRPYLTAGIDPVLNLTTNSQDYIKQKPFDCFLELGIGCDYYLPFFKFAPELKFCYGLTNSIDNSGLDDLIDKTMRPYRRSVTSGRSKMFVLTLYFE